MSTTRMHKQSPATPRLAIALAALGIIIVTFSHLLVDLHLQRTMTMLPPNFHFFVKALTPSSSWSSSAASRASRRLILEQASRVREMIDKQSSSSSSSLSPPSSPTAIAIEIPPPSSALYHPSSYQKKVRFGKRGFCNWLIPNHIMIGQYPGTTPESSSATMEEAQKHMDAIVTPLLAPRMHGDDGNEGDLNSVGTNAGIKMFCSLQDEIPSQNDDEVWSGNGGKIQLPIDGGREDFPGYFSHYAPMVALSLKRSLQSQSPSQSQSADTSVEFLHAPIIDLSTPDSSSLQTLLSTILSFMLDQDDDISGGSTDKVTSTSTGGAIYIHCWGGRGRAGLVGACLLSLIYPELSAEDCLDWVQKGYDTRDGAMFMPPGLRRSPQTARQREFVCEFIKDVRTKQNKA